MTAAEKAAAEGAKYKLTSLPSDFSFDRTASFGPQLSEIGYFTSNINGQDYYFVPMDTLTKGVIATGQYGFGAPSTYYFPKALSNEFQQELRNSGTYADVSNVKNPYGGTYGDYLQATGRSSKGYFVPINDVTRNVLENPQNAALGPNGESGIQGIINSPDRGLAWSLTNTNGHDLSFVTPDGLGYVWDKPHQTTLQKYLSKLGPVPGIVTAIFAPDRFDEVANITGTATMPLDFATNIFANKWFNIYKNT